MTQVYDKRMNISNEKKKRINITRVVSLEFTVIIIYIFSAGIYQKSVHTECGGILTISS